MVKHICKKETKMKLRKYIENKFLIESFQQFINYSFNKGAEGGNIHIYNSSRIAIELIKKFFAPLRVFTSKPIINVSTNEVTIRLFYYLAGEKNKDTNKKTIVRLNHNTLNNLGELLTEVFNRKVKLQFIKINHPQLDRTILAEYLRHNTQKYNFRRIKQTLFEKTTILDQVTILNEKYRKLPSYLVGIKVEISGRLMTERVRPRKTVSTRQVGAMKKFDKGVLIDYGTYVGKNKRGAYTIKVWIRQEIVQK